MINDISHAFPSCDYRILNFEKIDSESFFVEPVFALWEREFKKMSLHILNLALSYKQRFSMSKTHDLMARQFLTTVRSV